MVFEMNKTERLKQETEFQDKRVLHKEEKRFIVNLDKLYGVFNSRILGVRGKTMLNLGCGTGSMSIQAAKKNKVYAIDISPESIKVLKKDIKKNKAEKRVSAYVMDAESLRFKDNHFDIIYGSAILHHLDLNKVMGELKRVVKEKGKLYFIEPTSHNYLVNRYRKKTPEMRSKFEHPLSRDDIKTIKEYFPRIKIMGFYLLQTMMPSFVRHNDRFRWFRKVLDLADSFILAVFPFFKMYCYSILLEMKK